MSLAKTIKTLALGWSKIADSLAGCSRRIVTPALHKFEEKQTVNSVQNTIFQRATEARPARIKRLNDTKSWYSPTTIDHAFEADCHEIKSDPLTSKKKLTLDPLSP